MSKYSNVFGLPRRGVGLPGLTSFREPPADQTMHNDDVSGLLGAVNHAEHSQNTFSPLIVPYAKRKITPTFFIRESPLPTRGDLDLLRRCLLLRTKLLKEKRGL